MVEEAIGEDISGAAAGEEPMMTSLEIGSA